MDKIIYFTAGVTPTAPELAEIAGLNAAAAPKYQVIVKRGDAQVSQSYGHGIDDADFVAGTPPSAYSAFSVFDVDDEPITVGEDDTIAVSNSALDNSVDGTASITDGVLTVVLGATDQIVSSSDTVVVKNSAGSVSKNGTATVASGVISGVALASTVAMKANADAVTVVDSAGTSETSGVVNVASGVVTNVSLPTTDKIIKSTVQVPCPAPSGTRTTGYVFTIVNGAITAAVGY